MKNSMRIIITLGLAYLTGISLATVYGMSVTLIDAIVPCLMGLSYVVYDKAWRVRQERLKQDKLTEKSAVIIGFIFALTLVVGVKIDFYENVFYDFGIMDILIYPFLGSFFSALVLLLFYARDRIAANATGKSLSETKHLFYKLWILNLVAYLPYYLTFFPGNAGNDTWLSVSMIMGTEPWTNHHPVLFTGLMMLVIRATSFLNSLTISVGIFSFLQMVSFSAVMAYLASRICKKQVHVAVKLFAICMCAFHPFMGMYSVYITKDVIFAEIMILLCLQIYDQITEGGQGFRSWQGCFKIGALFLLSCMLRNNGIYISIVMAVVFLCLYKQYWKQILITFLSVICLFQIWTGPVFKSIGIEKQSFAEAASIPLQQVGRVLYEG